MNLKQLVTSISAVAISSFGTATTASAAVTINYGFDGNLLDYFNPAEISAGFVPQQTGGRLILYNNNSTGADMGAEAIASTFAPRYDQSWTASIAATIPTAYSYSAGSEFELDISVMFSSGSGSGTRNLQFTNTFNVGAAGGRNLIGYQEETDENYDLVALDFSDAPPSVSGSDTLTLQLSYDAAITTLTASSPGLGTYYSADLSDPGLLDWGMTASDTFSLQIAGWTDNQGITYENPMAFDDYSATIIPEPSTFLLLGLGGLTALLRRGK